MKINNTNNIQEQNFSAHALIRMQQRGIKKNCLELFKDYGHTTYLRDGAVGLSLNKLEKSFIRSDLSKSEFNKIEKQLNSYFIISQDGTIITAAKSTRKVKRQ